MVTRVPPAMEATATQVVLAAWTPYPKPAFVIMLPPPRALSDKDGWVTPDPLRWCYGVLAREVALRTA